MNARCDPSPPAAQVFEGRVSTRLVESIEARRLQLGRWMTTLRLATAIFFVLLYLAADRWLSSPLWNQSAGVLYAYSAASGLSCYAARRWPAFARLTGYLVPSLDVTVCIATLWALLPLAEHPEQLVGLNLASFVLIIASSQLWFSYRLLAVTSIVTIVWQLVLVAVATVDAVQAISATVTLLLTSVLCAINLRNTARLELSTAREIELEKLAVHQRKDLRSLEDQALLADRLATLGTLAAGVAHEINSPLAVIHSGTYWLAEQAKRFTDPDLREVVEDMTSAAHQLNAIAQDLRILGRKETDEQRSLDLGEVVVRSMRLVMPQLKDKARVVREIGASPHVIANETRLAQVLINLLVNAAQAIPDGQPLEHRITIRVGASTRGEALIEVSDTGSGISPEVQARLFEPFFTTKPQGIGTGLGLAICHRILLSLNATIDVNSVVGRGTTFRVVFPAVPARVDPA